MDAEKNKYVNESWKTEPKSWVGNNFLFAMKLNHLIKVIKNMCTVNIFAERPQYSSPVVKPQTGSSDPYR